MKTVLKNDVGVCVHFRLRSLVPMERCGAQYELDINQRLFFYFVVIFRQPVFSKSIAVPSLINNGLNSYQYDGHWRCAYKRPSHQSNPWLNDYDLVLPDLNTTLQERNENSSMDRHPTDLCWRLCES